jgi:deazaflavin-dependent oxidoreductase (nitroreductase family)
MKKDRAERERRRQGDAMSEMSEFNKRVIEEFRANGGKVGGQFANAPMLLLTTTGAKSGRSYTTPLVYSRDGDRIVIIASKAGAPSNPDWYYNLLAHPVVTIELGGEKFQARAAITSGEERERLFNNQAQMMAVFNEYRKKTTRQIPVIALERAR